MKGPWSVIREIPGREPELVATFQQKRDADAAVFKVAEAHAHLRGTKVYLRTADSADQLQVSRKGRVVRDQPHLPRLGEDVTVIVPEPARARSRARVPGAVSG